MGEKGVIRITLEGQQREQQQQLITCRMQEFGSCLEQGGMSLENR